MYNCLFGFSIGSPEVGYSIWILQCIFIMRPNVFLEHFYHVCVDGEWSSNIASDDKIIGAHCWISLPLMIFHPWVWYPLLVRLIPAASGVVMMWVVLITKVIKGFAVSTKKLRFIDPNILRMSYWYIFLHVRCFLRAINWYILMKKLIELVWIASALR